MPDEAASENPGESAPLASDDLLPVVYDELRRLARGHMAAESGPQTLTATALVHEAWLRVSADGGKQWQNRRHFFGAAAEAMRRILIDRAREKMAAKHGARAEHTSVEDLGIIAPSPDDELLAVHDALAKLAAEDALAGESVTLRFFAGLAWAEISDITGLPERDLGRQWQYARRWLHAEISGARG